MLMGKRIKISGVARNVVITFSSKLAMACVALLVSVIISRTLEPYGRGLFASLMALSGIGLQLANLGMPQSNNYYLSQDRAILGSLIANSTLFSIVAGLVASSIITCWAWYTGLADESGWVALSLVVMSVPIGLIYLMLINLLIPCQAIGIFNAIETSVKILILFIIGMMYIFDLASLQAYMLSSIVAQMLGVVLIFKNFKNEILNSSKFSMQLLISHMPYAFKSYVGTLVAFLVLRCDLLMVQYISGNEEVGYYSIAVGIFDMAYLFPATIGLIIFPRLVQMHDIHARKKATWRAVYVTGGGTAVAIFARHRCNI